jgi:muramidase (phage lysozyme)
MDKLAAARADGYTWDDIGAALAPRYDGALKDGYTPAEINGALGIKPNPEFDAKLREHMDPATWQDRPGNDPATWAMQTRQHYGRGLVTGAISSAEEFAGKALSGIFGLDKLIGPEALAQSQVGQDAWRGFIEGVAPGSPLGLSPEHEAFLERSGLFNGPGEHNVLKSLNQVVIAGGIVALDAIGRVFSGAGGAAAAVGAGIAGPQAGADIGNVVNYGPLVGPSLGALRAAGRLGLAGIGAVTGADIATAATEAASRAKRVFAGNLVSGRDLIDGAVALGKSVKPELVPGGAATTALNIANHNAETGESVVGTLDRAEHDPNFRNGLLSPQHPPARPDASVTSTPDGDFVVPTREGFLSHIAGGESGGTDPYNELYGGGSAKGLPTDATGFPQWAGKMGPAGISHAAGRYQFEPATWHAEASKLGLHDFSPASQDAAAWDLAKGDYAKRTGRDLEADLAAGDKSAAIDAVLRPTWTSLSDHGLTVAMRQRPGEVGAIGNLPGAPALTDDEKAMLAHVAPEAGDFEKAHNNVSELVDDAYRGFLQGDHPLVKIQDAVAKGRPISDAENPAFLRRMAETDTTAQYAIERNMTDLDGNVTGPGYKAILAPVKGELENFRAYIIAKWSIEKTYQGKESGLNYEQAERTALAGDAKFGPTFDKLVGFQNGSLVWMRDAGFHTKEEHAAWVTENKSRIPGYRADDNRPAAPRSPGSTVRDPIKEAKGSNKKLRFDPLEAILHDTMARAKLARENIANRAIADMAAEGGFGEKVATVPHKFDLTPAEMKRLGSALDPDDAGAVWRATGVPLRSNEVPIFRNGKLEKWVFKDPHVAEVLRGYDRQGLNTIQRILAFTARIYRTGIVAAPTFPLRLLTYDVPWQFITKPGFRNTLADTYDGLITQIAALMGNAGRAAKLDFYKRQGAAERIFNGLSGDAYVQSVLRGVDDAAGKSVWNSTGGAALKGVQAWSQFITQSQRIGRFNRGIAAGESPLRAGVAATEAAFHRSGFGGPMSKNINRISPFFSAYLNGMNQTIRGQLGIGKTVLGEDRDPVGFTAKALALITLPTLANYAHSRDKEWYKAAPDWQKNNGLLFNVGSEASPVVIYIPYPPLIGLLYGGIPRMLVDGFLADRPHAAAHLLSSLGASLAPPMGAFAGATILPIIEHIANHSFFRDQPLVSEDTKRSKLPPEQGSPWSSGAARELSKFTGFSPPVIDNYISGWGGTLGTTAVRTADFLLGTGPRANNPPAWKVSDLPLISSWTARYPNANAQPISDFRERYESAQQVHGSLEQSLKDNDLARFTDLVKANPFAARLFGFKLSTEGKMIVGDRDPATLAPYRDALAKLPPATPEIQEIVTGQKVLGLLRDYAEAIGAAAKGEPITEYDVSQAAAEHPSMNQMPGKHTLSGTDKRQLLDSVYSQMQRVAEKGGKAMDRAGMW